MISLSKKYAGIGPLIIMIERLVNGTNSGKAKCMAEYYHHWERKVLDSLTNMLLRLLYFPIPLLKNQSISLPLGEMQQANVPLLLYTLPFRNFRDFNVALKESGPLFQIDVILSSPKIILQPYKNDIYWMIMHCVRECVESTKVWELFKDLQSKLNNLN